MTYSRNYLNQFLNPDCDRKDYDGVVQDLVSKVLANERISLAEQQFICSIIKMLRKGDTNELAFKIDDCKPCNDYSFRNRYIKYYNDLNGNNDIFDFDGPIESAKKKSDVAYLEKEYHDWESHINANLKGEELINHVAQETKEQLKLLKRYCDKLSIGSNYRKYLIKSLTLHGKYIYLLVKEFYQELAAEYQTIEINGQKILIDSFTYVHTMFRHYSSSLKQHQGRKSYHFDEIVGFKEIPMFLFNLLDCFKSINASINNDKLDVLINGKPYRLYFKKVTRTYNGKLEEYYRVQTFFPVEDKRELEILNNSKLSKTNCGYEFYL